MTDSVKMEVENWRMFGHEWAVDMLRQQILNNSIRHAYLFTGPAGIGRRTLALRFFQALSCSTNPGKAEPCGNCQVCKQIEAMQFADLSVVQAEKEGGTLVVEDVRAIKRSMVLKPFMGGHRFALFMRFQEANASASNALLKTLEETPSHGLIVLTADNSEHLLPTIASRCEQLRLRPLSVGAMEDILKSQKTEGELAHLVAHVSGGRPGYAFRMLGNPSLMDFRSERLDDLQQLLRASRVEKFTYAEKFANRKNDARERPRETLLIWLSFWRDTMIHASGSTAPLVNIDRIEEITSLANLLGISPSRDMVENMEKAIDKLEKNVNPRLLFEVILLDLPAILKYISGISGKMIR